MRRLLPALLPLLLFTACAGGEAPPPGPTASVRAGFPPGGIVDLIVVDAVDRLPLHAADLVAPDGTATPARYIDVAAAPRFATGQSTAADPWQSAFNGGGSATALAIESPQSGAALYSREQLLATVSTADIALPDPAAYRRDWAHYRIRLTFGVSPATAETREIPAPQPPAPAS
ncbi:MAG TPA: hypothetical protein VND95_08115 [Stellaceae bacterium]|nr:hypothetical protein [Stellaceae bacterium]